ncbi:MAG TPA: tetratricopeptide repeat protein [Candidatus Acidoferrales bacterium]|nr:tetratricopeptide repeat protein [Candidatus Acidoferrales bacterium]
MREAARTKRRCASCGATVRAKDRFCGSCGTPLGDASTAPASRQTSASLQVGAHAAGLLSEQRKVVTVVFADLSGSTPLGERLDPEELRGILASYFSTLSSQIARYEGTVDKYIGDAVMAVFGAPVSHEDDAERAINAALAMQSSMARLNAELERAHGVRLSLRIGVNTGEVVAGMLAGDVQAAYTVVGDAVNTAQRIESAAPVGQVVVSATTRRLAIHSFEFEALPPVQLKGKTEPMTPYRVVRRRYEEIAPDATSFVGRARELQYLRDAVVEAVMGRGRAIVVMGDAGVGKSRLVGEFRAGLISSIDRLVVRCASFETNTPYAAIADLFRLLFSIHATDDEETARHAILAGSAAIGGASDDLTVALILDILGYAERSKTDPETRRRMLLRVVRGLLQVESERATLVLVVEDLQWIDDASAQIFTEIARDVPSLPVMFVGTARPGWASPWTVDRIALAPFGEAESRAMMEEIFEAPVDDALFATVLERTGGNAFFVEEVARELLATDLVTERTGRVGLRADARDAVPATIRKLLESRIDRLDDGPRRVIQLASVSGRTFWFRVVQQLAPDRDVATDIAVLEREQLIAVRSSAPELTYTFRQALIQEVAYGMQLQSQRRAAHGAVARAVEALYPSRLEEFVDFLAYQYDLDDDEAQALVWLSRAGDRARRLFANEEAIRLYRLALRRAEPDDGPVGAATLLEHIGQVETLLGRYESAQHSFGEALALVAIRPERRARLLRRVGYVLERRGSYDEALATLDEARKALGDRDAEEAARITLNIGQVRFWRGEYDDARAALQSAVRAGEALGVGDIVANALKLLGNVANNLGDIRDAEELYRRSRVAYERLEDLVGVADVRSNLGMIYRRMGRWDDSIGEYAASLSVRERIGHLRGIAASHNNLGEVYRSRGEPAEAIPHYLQAIALLESAGGAADSAVVLMSLGAARAESGDVRGGLADLREAEKRVHMLGRTKYLPDLYRLLASAELSAGNVEAARDLATRSLDLATAAGARHLEAMAQRVLGEALIEAGDPDAARPLIESSCETLREAGEAVELAKSEALRKRLAPKVSG